MKKPKREEYRVLSITVLHDETTMEKMNKLQDKMVEEVRKLRLKRKAHISDRLV